MQSFQFFLHYVFCPFVFTTGVVYTGAVWPEWLWYWVGVGILLWIFWPVGMYRRRFETAHLDEFEAECKANGEMSSFKGLVLAGGPYLVIFLAIYTSLLTTPLIMEQYLGIDIEAVTKERQERVESKRHSGSSPVPE